MPTVDTTSTLGLIKQADTLEVSGCRAAIDALGNSVENVEYRPIRRRFPYAAMDSVRELMRHGDR